MNLNDQLHGLSDHLTWVVPELLLATGLCLVLILGLFQKRKFDLLQLFSFLFCALSFFITLLLWPGKPTTLFLGMLRSDDYSSYFRLLADAGGAIVVLMTQRNQVQKPVEYFLLILAVVLGAHLLVMSMNFIMVVLAMELISLSSYALAGWSFSKSGVEGSLKYFLFGSVATAVMIYGMSLIFGLSGTLDFSSEQFVSSLIHEKSPLLLVGGLMTMAGFLFKIAAAPMHLWTPDVYQSAPTPVVAFFSVVPKMAGFGALVKFILAINLYRQTPFDWQLILAMIAGLSITVGNFSALWQTSPKRMLAYSSIAQAGFLLIGVVSMSQSGVHAMLFYGAVLLIMNFLTFLSLQQFEREGATDIASFAGLGKSGSFKSIALTTGLISLVGFPLTAGFSAKLFIFSSLWETYSQTDTRALVVLLVFGLINTVVSLFYYIKIPYYMFIKDGRETAVFSGKMPVLENLLSCLLVIGLFLLFFRPDLLMGWIIRINFVL
jgi:NADH-quinone oxidoreductase subunit N